MRNILLFIMFLLMSLNTYAQEQRMVSGYWVANYQLTSYGIGIQFKNKIINELFIANNIIMLFNNEYEVNKMINLDANIQYALKYKNNSSNSRYYPFIGVGWANYNTEYFKDHYGDLQKDMESPVRGNSIFLNLGIGTTLQLFDNISVNGEYKWATSKGRVHSTWLLGIGISFH